MSIDSTEMPNMFGGAGQTEYAEHSRFARAKKVISGPLYLAENASDATKSITPISSALTNTSASLTLLKNKAYRIIVSVDAYFRMSVGADTAVANDVYLPANQPIIMTTERWDTFSAIRVSGTSGVMQAVEVK